MSQKRFRSIVVRSSVRLLVSCGCEDQIIFTFFFLTIQPAGQRRQYICQNNFLIADIYISISTETFDIENIKYEKKLAIVRFRYIL